MVLNPALLALFLLNIALLYLLLFPLLSFGSHLCLFLFLLRSLLFFLLLALANDFILLLFGSFFGRPTALPLSIHLFVSLPIFFFSFCSEPFLSIHSVNVLLSLLGLLRLTRLNFRFERETLLISLFAGSQELRLLLSLLTLLVCDSFLSIIFSITILYCWLAIAGGLLSFSSIMLSFESYSFLISFSASLHKFHLFLDLFIFLCLYRPALIFLRLTLSLLALLIIFLVFKPIQSILLLSQSPIDSVHLCFMGSSFFSLLLSLSVLLSLSFAFSFAGTFPLLSIVLLASGRFTSLSLLLECGYLLCFGFFFSLFTLLLLTVVVVVVLTGSLCGRYTGLIDVARLWCQC